MSYAELRTQTTTRLENALQPPVVLNNLHWMSGMGLLEFLRTVGLHARVNSMIARERCG